MGIEEFSLQLEGELKNASVPGDLANENAFEHGFVIPTVLKVAADFSDLLLFTHRPNKGVSTTCAPTCEEAERMRDGRVIGCHKCWTRSKDWAAITVFGMRNTLDLTVRDPNGRTLAIEIKWSSNNGDFQRFVGQCAIATARHDLVLGVFGKRRPTKVKRASGANTDRQEELLQSLKRIGVGIVVLQAPSDLASLDVVTPT